MTWKDINILFNMAFLAFYEKLTEEAGRRETLH